MSQNSGYRGNLAISGVTLQGIDLSGAILSNVRIRDSRIDDCCFARARLDDLRIWGTEFSSCDFSHANLPGIRLGSGVEYGGPNIWRSVNFSNANLRAAGAKQAIFVDCDFSRAKIDGVEFRQCAMDGVTFAGRLRDVGFDGRELSDSPASPEFRRIIMREAILDMCDIRGCVFIDSVFPNDEDIIPIAHFPKVAERALRALAEDSSIASGDMKAYLGHALRGPAQSPDSILLLNLRDLRRHYPGGEETVRLARRLLVDSGAE